MNMSHYNSHTATILTWFLLNWPSFLKDFMVLAVNIPLSLTLPSFQVIWLVPHHVLVGTSFPKRSVALSGWIQGHRIVYLFESPHFSCLSKEKILFWFLQGSVFLFSSSFEATSQFLNILCLDKSKCPQSSGICHTCYVWNLIRLILLAGVTYHLVSISITQFGIKI